jgi:hypothetical protein
MELEQTRAITQAWLTARLGRSKKVPSLNSLLGIKRKAEEAKTKEQVEKEKQDLIAVYNKYVRGKTDGPRQDNSTGGD